MFPPFPHYQTLCCERENFILSGKNIIFSGRNIISSMRNIISSWRNNISSWQYIISVGGNIVISGRDIILSNLLNEILKILPRLKISFIDFLAELDHFRQNIFHSSMLDAGWLMSEGFFCF